MNIKLFREDSDVSNVGYSIKYREDFYLLICSTALRFAAAGAPFAARRIRILATNQPA
jgi:hypothetical protein